MRELFNDANRRGILRSMDDEFSECLKKRFNCGLQIKVHIIGECRLDQLLGALERLASDGVPSDWLIKLTYNELCHPEQVDRIDASCDVQPGQFASRMSFLPAAIGEKRMQHCLPFCLMIDAGVIIVGSSDAPVDSDNPLIGLHLAIVRYEAMALMSGYHVTQR
jgi:predicted amidohydrolase YtcJ